MLDLVKSHVKSDATVEEMDTERKIKFKSIVWVKVCSLLIIAISMHLA